MSDEVIIDGVNVAECKFFQSEYLEDNSVFCEFCTMFYNACLNNPDCYFKQLQGAKAELEQYKKSKQASYEAMQKEWNAAINELRDVKAENEKLQAEIENYKTEIMTLRKGYDEEDCTATCPEIQRLSKELDNYRRVD